LRILAISSEDAAKVQPFIFQKGITYPVGIYNAHAEGYGGGGIPHAYLIAPDGLVAWEGHPASLQEGQVEDVVRQARDFYVRKVAAELKPAAAAFEKGKLAEAKALAEAAKAKGGGREVEADADYVLARVTATVASWNRTVEKGAEDGLYTEVFDALAKIQKHYPGTDEATAAAAKDKELKADPVVARELDAAKKLEKIMEDARRAEGDEKKLKGVAKKLEKFIEAYPTSKASKRAQQLLDGMQQK
jgi:hypothetical protein